MLMGLGALPEDTLEEDAFKTEVLKSGSIRICIGISTLVLISIEQLRTFHTFGIE
jgi:hypothetical protein